MTASRRQPRFDVARLISGGLLIALILLIVGRDYPLIGHDFRYYIPRLLDTLIFENVNGLLAIQWYTPSFGSGLPAYPNPQHLQHSALQPLTFLIGPWGAIQLTTALASAIGFYAFAWFLERRLGLAATASTLGAVFFVGNGFYIEHSIVGHVGFQLWPLASVIVLALTNPRGRVFRNACVVALVCAGMLYHAGIYLIILIALSVLVLLPVMAIANPPSIDLKRIVSIAAVALALSVAIVASKVHAVLAFMRHFPREIHDIYEVSVLHGLTGLVTQLLGVMTLAPPLTLAGYEAVDVGDGLSRLIDARDRFGIWELDVSLSPALWVLLCAGVIEAVAHVRARGWSLERSHVFAGLAAIVVTWLLIEATLARGFIYPLIKPLPILRSLHVNPRLAAAFIMPLALIAAVVAHRRWSRPNGRLVITALLWLAVASPLAYWLLPPAAHQRSFDITRSIESYERIKSGGVSEVKQIAWVDDDEAIAINASSYRPYEPLFGYSLEDFATEATAGDIRQVSGAAFNMTNPAGLVFAEENGLRPFQRIAVTDEPNLDALVRHGQPQWSIPRVQRYLNWLSACAFVLTLLGAFMSLPRRER